MLVTAVIIFVNLYSFAVAGLYSIACYSLFMSEHLAYNVD